jgi:Rrf2 family protein
MERKIMKMSTKGRYAVQILMSIARQQHNGPVPKKIIAVEEGISADYIEQIIVPLKKAGIAVGIRGVKGGFLLSKDPADITVFDVLRASDGKKYMIKCKCAKCRKNAGTCATCVVWKEASTILKEFFETITLQDLLDRPE